MRRLMLPSLAIAAALSFAACSSAPAASPRAASPSAPASAKATATPVAPTGSPSSTPSQAAPTDTAPSSSTSGMAGHGHAVDVVIKDFTFQPDEIEVAVGQVVSWTNEDGEPHTVRSADGSISSAIIGREPFEWTVEGTPGTRVPYACSIHPQMEGLVEITQ